MGYNGETRDPGISANLRRTASESFKMLKGAANGLVSNAAPELETPHPVTLRVIADAPVVAPVPPGASPSVLSINVEIVGSIVSPDDVHIYGKVDGNIRAAGLTVCAGGSVKGDIVAETVTVHGTVEGRIHAQKVQLCAGAMMRGDIVHGALGIDTSATFEGTSKRSQDPRADAAAVKR